MSKLINSSKGQTSSLKNFKWSQHFGLHRIVHYFRLLCIGIKGYFFGFCAEMSAMEYMFIKMTHIYSFICQLFFLTLCEVAIIRANDFEMKQDEKLVSGLTSLLFYSVFGYFVNRIKEIYLSDWSRNRRSNNVYNYREYAQWLFKILIEWAKAIIVVICLREQGMNCQPDLLYNIITFVYYLCTEKVFGELFELGVTFLRFDIFDAMEYLYVPMFLRIYTTAASAILIGYLLNTQYAKYAAMSSYFLLYLNLKDLISNYIYPLMLEKQTFASFRTATARDIENWDDICAVCLNRMSKARITPCHHLFHPRCLKRCLKASFQCPLCKHNFLQ